MRGYSNMSTPIDIGSECKTLSCVLSVHCNLLRASSNARFASVLAGSAATHRSVTFSILPHSPSISCPAACINQGCMSAGSSRMGSPEHCLESG